MRLEYDGDRFLRNYPLYRFNEGELSSTRARGILFMTQLFKLSSWKSAITLKTEPHTSRNNFGENVETLHNNHEVAGQLIAGFPSTRGFTSLPHDE
jgi:hypothetical protein